MHVLTFLSYDGPSTTDLHTLISLQCLYSTSSAQPLPLPHASSSLPSPPSRTIQGRSMRTSHSAAQTSVRHQRCSKRPTRASQGRSMQATSMTLSASAHRSCWTASLSPAACRAGLPRDVPAWALMFTALEAAEDWFDPVRHMLPRYFGAPKEDTAAGTRTVTYLARQDGLEGERLRTMRRCWMTGITVHVVNEMASWTERMRAVARSTIVLSIFGDHVADTVFMKRGAAERFDGLVTAHVLKIAV
ncbi:hypothetical protein EDB89DRAFT_2247557 [Lactarius sanguifluus]|nr:hypothetical protein EDB89DRAFT_2247557 [Lactarius sanguifluus]